MVLLALGLLIWGCLHLVPAVARPTRERLIERIGAQAYQGAFALSLVVAILLMVFGWRSVTPQTVYWSPAWGIRVAEVGVFFALFLFAASGVPSNVKRLIRHPQLTGVALWAASHLVANGDPRALLLFGGMLVWSVVEIAAINRRDGAWEKPEPEPGSAVLKPLIGAAVVYVGLWFAHPWIAGVPA